MNKLKGVAGQEAEYKRLQALTKQQGRESASLVRQVTRRGNLAASKMNVMDTGAAKTWTKAVGLKGVLSGQSAKTTESYSGYIDRLAKDAAKAAERAAPSRQDENDARDNAAKAYRDGNAAAIQARADAAQQAKEMASSIAGKLVEATNERNDRLIEAMRDRGGDDRDHRELDDAKRQREEILRANPRAAEENSSTLHHENMRIEEARAQILRKANIDRQLMDSEPVKEMQRNVDVLSRSSRTAKEQSDQLNKAAENFAKDVEANAIITGKAAADALRDAARLTAEEVGRRGVGITPNILDPDRVATATLKKFRTKTGRDQRIKDVLKELDDEGAAPTPPTDTESPTPPTTA